jgi:hypothetical protein
MQRASEILRQWETPLILLFWYYVLGAIVTCVVYTRCRERRAANPPRYRMLFASALALVFTPSVITDFFLFMIPGPAIAGFLLLLPSVFGHPDLLLVELLYYILPMAVVFSLSYVVLLWLDKHHSSGKQTA